MKMIFIFIAFILNSLITLGEKILFTLGLILELFYKFYNWLQKKKAYALFRIKILINQKNFILQKKLSSFRIKAQKNLFLTKTILYLWIFNLIKIIRYPFRQIKKAAIRLRVIVFKFKRNRKVRKQKKYSKYTVSTSLSFPQKFKYFIYGYLFSLVFVFIPLLFLIFLQNLPNPKSMGLQQIPQTTKIYDRNHVLLYQIYATQNRTIVSLSEIPRSLQEATIAIEDKNFYNHIGFDILAIARSVKENLSNKELQGGSTITQQLIKSALLTPETNISRKIKEVILAFWAERIYNKNQILEMYFNQVPYGGTAWGVEAASEVYFGKRVKDLDLAECAFLAGIPRAPTIYSPFGSTPTVWKKRQKEVLKRMFEIGYITKTQKIEAEKKELTFQSPQTPIYAPHFVMYLKDVLIKKYGLPMVEKGGLNVVTSLDLKLQDKAQKIVTEEVNNDFYLNLTNGATLITNPQNGDILAMVGSKDFSDPESGNVNLTTALRQPGSSIKVVTYSAAISQGVTSATIIDDSATAFTSPGSPPYAPVNYDGKFHGKVPIRIALANSFNIPAVKLANQLGVPTVIDYGKKMGIKNWNSPEKYGLSITLGGAEVNMLDLATVYGVLANDGIRIDLNPILKITDSKGNLLEEKKSVLGRRVLDEGVAFIMSDILADNNSRAWEFGTNSPLYIPSHRVSVKTGTSDNKRDNWTIGYTKNYTVAVWVGNNNNSPMSQSLASGITGAAPIWHKIIEELLVKNPDNKLIIPSNIVQKACLGRMEYFIKGTENSVSCVLPPPVSPSPTKTP